MFNFIYFWFSIFEYNQNFSSEELPYHSEVGWDGLAGYYAAFGFRAWAAKVP